jgi:hypothetical protein
MNAKGGVIDGPSSAGLCDPDRVWVFPGELDDPVRTD